MISNIFRKRSFGGGGGGGGGKKKGGRGAELLFFR